MKIRDSIYVIAFLSCIVPMLFLSIFINNTISNRVKSEKSYKIDMALAHVNFYSRELLYEVHDSIDTIIHLSSIQDNKEHLIDFMINLGDSNSEVDRYFLGDSDGRFYGGWERTTEEILEQKRNHYIREAFDPRNRKWYKDGIKSDGFVIGDLYQDAFNDNLTITISKKILSNNKIKGVAGVDFNITPITKRLKELNPWKEGGFLIVSESGDLIIDASSSGSFYANHIAHINNLTDGRYVDSHDSDIIYQVMSLDYFDFKLIGVFSKDEIFTPLSTIRKTIILITSFSLLFSACAVALLGQHIDKSMNRLSYLIDSIAKGNYTKNIDALSSIIDDKSELTLVKEAVKNMQDQIKDREKNLKDIAEIDELTKSLNRKAIINIMNLELQKTLNFSTEFSIIMIDYDNFKNINDTFGHLFGDQVLIEVSKLIQSTLKTSDYIGRYGGEEFLILLPGTEISDAIKVAERIRVKVSKMIWEVDTKVTVSGGIVQATNEKNVEELIKKADDLLYRAKDRGRNRFES